MAQQFTLPRQVKINVAGRPYAGAQAFFYQTGTETLQTVYQDPELTTPHDQPVPSDDDGYFPVIWLDNEAEFDYRVVVKSSTGVLLEDIPNVPKVPFGSTDISGTLDSLKRTQTEHLLNLVPVNTAYLPGNIRRYGAVVDGVADDSVAFRQALDVAAVDGTNVFCEPPGQIKLNSVVYIPQRTSTATRYGVTIDLYGCTLIGQGRGTGKILETGTGSSSTSGATNVGQADESAASLHFGTIIRGARFRNCDVAINLFNFTKGCKLEDLYFEEVEQAVTTDRCFYLELHNCHAQVSAIASGKVLFDFNDNNNAITLIGCEAGGSAGGTTGVGFRFTGQTSGVVFHGNTAENMAKGVVINSSCQSIDIRANVFEGLTIAIDATAAGTKEMDVAANFFYQCTTVINAVEWYSGRFASGQHLQGTGSAVVINDASSFCTVELPTQIFTEATANASAVSLPSNYTIGSSVRLVAPREVYAAASGTSTPLAIDSSEGLPGIPAFAYAGGPTSNGASFTVPFCTQTLSSGSSVINTQINWNVYFTHVVFNFYSEINGARTFAGVAYGAGTGVDIKRHDGESTFTIVASNNSGKLRLTVSGAGHSGFTSAGFWGQVRHA